MRIDRRLFSSVLAWRFFILFVVSALVPTSILAVFAYRHVSGQLYEQSTIRLRQATRAEGLSVYERLLFVESELANLELHPELLQASGTRLERPFDALAEVSPAEGVVPLYGSLDAAPALADVQLDHLEKGGITLTTLDATALPATLAMVRPLGDGAVVEHLLIGVISPDYLWGDEGQNFAPPGAEICVFDERRALIYGSYGGCADYSGTIAERASEGVFGDFSISVGGEEHQASFRNLFLKPRFGITDWTFVLAEPRTIILEPMHGFQLLFPPVVFLSLWIVLLLSIYSIRHSLIPLDRLKEGAERIAVRDFSRSIEVTSGDEFDDVARAFNDMSSQLRRHLKSLDANAAMHRAVLSEVDRKSIFRTAAAGALEALDCDLASIAHRGDNDTFDAGASFGPGGVEPIGKYITVKLPEKTIELLESVDQWATVDEIDGLSALLAAFPTAGQHAIIAFPIILLGSLHAVFFIGRKNLEGFSEEDLEQARQLADQVAVALANANLLEELRSLTWGTLEAFARAIDAKSSWTGGHSERVTRVSVRIAREMGFSKTELEVMRRGALLHDIGKLGVSMEVLDKPSRLDKEELDHVRTHPLIGSRILEPILTLRDILPIVTQHHERYDGKGYPAGLSGTQIDLKARILALADAFDAMTSNRPYRKGFAQEIAVAEIRREAGRQFDPIVVEAFVRAIEADPRVFAAPLGVVAIGKVEDGRMS